MDQEGLLNLQIAPRQGAQLLLDGSENQLVAVALRQYDPDEKPRKPFDPKTKRISNAEHAKFAAEAASRDRDYQKKIKKADWREQSRAFREAIKMTGTPKTTEEDK